MFHIISGTLTGTGTLRITKNASFHTASPKEYSIVPRTNSQESSSKHHPWSLPNFFTFRKLWVLILVLSLSYVCSNIQSTTASPLPHSHSSSHHPSTSLPTREVSRKFPVYPLPALSLIHI